MQWYNESVRNLERGRTKKKYLDWRMYKRQQENTEKEFGKYNISSSKNVYGKFKARQIDIIILIS